MAQIAEAIQLPDYGQVLWTPETRHFAFHGGRGGAKSHTIAKHLLIKGAETEQRTSCGREIQKNIAESVKQLLDDQIDLLGLHDYYESTDKEIYGLRNNSKFTFMGVWRNPQGIRSMEGYDTFWGEEAAGFSQKSLTILVPTLRKEGSRFIWSWNPEYEHDPIDRMFRGPAGPPPRSIVKQVGWQDNPWFPPDLREAMEHDYANDPDKADHVWGGQYIKAVEGAYYAHQLRLAREQGRVTILAGDPNFSYRAFWDLGHSDATAIWVAQFVESRINVIDYCEGMGQPPSYYMNWLRSSGYEGCECVLPHDGDSVHPENPIAMSYRQQLTNAGFKTKLIKNQGKGAAMARVNATRRLFPRVWINEDACRVGLRALGHYHAKIDEERNADLGPEHDWSSHGADAFGLMAIAYEEPRQQIEDPILPEYGTIA